MRAELSPFILAEKCALLKDIRATCAISRKNVHSRTDILRKGDIPHPNLKENSLKSEKFENRQYSKGETPPPPFSKGKSALNGKSKQAAECVKDYTTVETPTIVRIEEWQTLYTTAPDTQPSQRNNALHDRLAEAVNYNDATGNGETNRVDDAQCTNTPAFNTTVRR